MDFCSSCLKNSVFNHILNRLDFMGASYRRRLPCMERPLQVGSPHCWHAMAYDDCISGRTGPIKAHSLVNLSSSTTRYPCCLPITNDQRFHGSHDSSYLTLTSSHPTLEEKLLFSIYNPFNGDFFQLPSTVRDHEGLRNPMRRIFLPNSRPSHLTVWL